MTSILRIPCHSLRHHILQFHLLIDADVLGGSISFDFSELFSRVLRLLGVWVCCTRRQSPFAGCLSPLSCSGAFISPVCPHGVGNRCCGCLEMIKGGPVPGKERVVQRCWILRGTTMECFATILTAAIASDASLLVGITIQHARIYGHLSTGTITTMLTTATTI